MKAQLSGTVNVPFLFSASSTTRASGKGLKSLILGTFGSGRPKVRRDGVGTRVVRHGHANRRAADLDLTKLRSKPPARPLAQNGAAAGAGAAAPGAPAPAAAPLPGAVPTVHHAPVMPFAARLNACASRESLAPQIAKLEARRSEASKIRGEGEAGPIHLYDNTRIKLGMDVDAALRSVRNLVAEARLPGVPAQDLAEALARQRDLTRLAAEVACPGMLSMPDLPEQGHVLDPREDDSDDLAGFKEEAALIADLVARLDGGEALTSSDGRPLTLADLRDAVTTLRDSHDPDDRAMRRVGSYLTRLCNRAEDRRVAAGTVAVLIAFQDKAPALEALAKGSPISTKDGFSLSAMLREVSAYTTKRSPEALEAAAAFLAGEKLPADFRPSDPGTAAYALAMRVRDAERTAVELARGKLDPNTATPQDIAAALENARKGGRDAALKREELNRLASRLVRLKGPERAARLAPAFWTKTNAAGVTGAEAVMKQVVDPGRPPDTKRSLELAVVHLAELEHAVMRLERNWLGADSDDHRSARYQNDLDADRVLRDAGITGKGLKRLKLDGREKSEAVTVLARLNQAGFDSILQTKAQLNVVNRAASQVSRNKDIQGMAGGMVDVSAPATARILKQDILTAAASIVPDRRVASTTGSAADIGFKTLALGIADAVRGSGDQMRIESELYQALEVQVADHHGALARIDKEVADLRAGLKDTHADLVVHKAIRPAERVLAAFAALDADARMSTADTQAELRARCDDLRGLDLDRLTLPLGGDLPAALRRGASFDLAALPQADRDRLRQAATAVSFVSSGQWRDKNAVGRRIEGTVARMDALAADRRAEHREAIEGVTQMVRAAILEAWPADNVEFTVKDGQMHRAFNPADKRAQIENRLRDWGIAPEDYAPEIDGALYGALEGPTLQVWRDEMRFPLVASGHSPSLGSQLRVELRDGLSQDGAARIARTEFGKAKARVGEIRAAVKAAPGDIGAAVRALPGDVEARLGALRAEVDEDGAAVLGKRLAMRAGAAIRDKVLNHQPMDERTKEGLTALIDGLAANDKLTFKAGHRITFDSGKVPAGDPLNIVKVSGQLSVANIDQLVIERGSDGYKLTVRIGGETKAAANAHVSPSTDQLHQSYASASASAGIYASRGGSAVVSFNFGKDDQGRAALSGAMTAIMERRDLTVDHLKHLQDGASGFEVTGKVGAGAKIKGTAGMTDMPFAQDGADGWMGHYNKGSVGVSAVLAAGVDANVAAKTGKTFSANSTTFSAEAKETVTLTAAAALSAGFMSPTSMAVGSLMQGSGAQDHFTKSKVDKDTGQTNQVPTYDLSNVSTSEDLLSVAGEIAVSRTQKWKQERSEGQHYTKVEYTAQANTKAFALTRFPGIAWPSLTKAMRNETVRRNVEATMAVMGDNDELAVTYALKPHKMKLANTMLDRAATAAQNGDTLLSLDYKARAEAIVAHPLNYKPEKMVIFSVREEKGVDLRLNLRHVAWDTTSEAKFDHVKIEMRFG